jgi:HEAT repeat protein
VLNSLLAIELLARHDDPESIELLTNMVSHSSTVVQSRSLERLFQIDINLVDQHAETLITSADSNVRRWCARAMIRKQNVGRIQMICSLLDDVNPSLRREAADGLVSLAELPGFRDEVLQRTTEIIDQNTWRGCEQAIVVLTKLDHKPSGERMVELLGHGRGEVQVASAWGLTRLRIKELLPGMLDHAQSIYEGFRAGELDDGIPGASLHVAHLFLAFGDQRYLESNGLLRKYLPKNMSLGVESRAAAAWALGMLYEDDVQEDLAAAMVKRLNDSSSPEPEIDEVRWMCAIALGRMKAESALSDLRENAGNGSVGGACHWAIERMTGEVPPPPKNVVGRIDGWFLAPIQDE